MNYPDNMNWSLYDRTIGSVMSDAEIICESHAHKLNAAINRAYKDYPYSGTARREMIATALTKAKNVLERCAPLLSAKEKLEVLSAWTAAMEYDVEGSIEGVRENALDVIGIYRQAMERNEL